MLGKALNFLLDRKKGYETAVLAHPPQTMEQFKYMVGKYEECCELIKEIEDILRGKEDE